MKLKQLAEKVYQGWCEIDTPPEHIHQRIITDILEALKEADAEGYRRGIEEAANLVDQTNATMSIAVLSNMIRALLPSEGKGERHG